MPALAAAVAGAAAASMTASALGTTIAAASFGEALVIAAAASAASSIVAQGMVGGTTAPDLGGSKFMVRQPMAPHQWIYGRTRVGGVITFLEQSYDNQYLDLVITVAGHEVDEIEQVWAEDQVLTILDGAFGPAANGNVTAPPIYVGLGFSYIRAELSKGDEAAGVQPFADLVTLSLANAISVWEQEGEVGPAPTEGKWTNDHCQTGLAKVWLRMGPWHPTPFGSGVPSFSFLVKGKKVYDPRTTLTAWSENAALCEADYLCSAAGLEEVYADGINETQLIAAANECDEAVLLATGSPLEYEKRYTLNGAFTRAHTPREVLTHMNSAHGGFVRRVAGKWRIEPAVYATPESEALTVEDLRGPLKIIPRVSRRELANVVRGMFTDRLQNYQSVDYPPATEAAYVAEDQGEEIAREVNMPFTQSGATAQRLAKVALERNRRQRVIEFPGKLGCYRYKPGDVVPVTLSRYGLLAAPHEVMSTRLVIGSGVGGEGVILGCDLVLREIDAAVYDWSVLDEQAMTQPVTLGLPELTAGTAIAGLTAQSGTAYLWVNGDGTVVPRVRLGFTTPASLFITHYEVQFSRSGVSPTEWRDAPDVIAPAAEAFAHPVEDGVSYDLRIRSAMHQGAVGEWAYVLGHTVAGKTEKPSDVTGAMALQNGDVVVFGCTQSTEPDHDFVEVRWLDFGDEVWGNGIPVANILRGRALPSASIPRGEWTFLFKNVDTSGNYSENAARADLRVTDDGYTEIAVKQSAPDWLGELSNFVVSVSGALVPTSTKTPSQHTKAELFASFVPYPQAICRYTEEIDKGADGASRLYADIVSELGPGIVAGTASPQHQVDIRTSSGAYDGFENWAIGSAEFRYALSRIELDTSVGVAKITRFETIADKRTRTETGTFTTDAGGSVAVSFSEAFHVAPTVTPAAQGSGDLTATADAVTVNGFTAYLKSGGVAAAGNGTYTAIGA